MDLNEAIKRSKDDVCAMVREVFTDKEVSVEVMRDACIIFRVEEATLTFADLNKLATAFRTRHIDVNGYSRGGACNTCDYGREQGLEFTVRFPE